MNRFSRILFILYLELFLVLAILIIFLGGLRSANSHFLAYIFVILGLARREIVLGRAVLIRCFKQVGSLNLDIYVSRKC